MASKSNVSLAINIIFFAILCRYATCSNPFGLPRPTPTPTPSPSRTPTPSPTPTPTPTPSPTPTPTPTMAPTPTPSTTPTPAPAPTLTPTPTPTPTSMPPTLTPIPPPIPSTVTCSVDTLRLGVCANLPGLGIRVGPPSATSCCTILNDVAELEAAVCLCTAIKANVLGINLNVSLALSMVLNDCGKQVPDGFSCT